MIAPPTLDRLRADLRAGRLTSVELVDRCLARIGTGGSLNAVVELDADTARREARAADDVLRAQAAPPPLCGLPVTVKRTFEVRGFMHAEQDVDPGAPYGVPAARDAEVVARLRELGAIVLGRTNAPPRTADIDTWHPLFGRTGHPQDSARSPAGSSGGCAAAVAAGHSLVSIGSDVTGSARIPAHVCGVYALRTSAGSLPHAGHLPGDVAGCEAMLSVSPIARYAQDLRLVWHALRGTEPPPAGAAAPARIAAVLADPAAPVSTEVTASLQTAVARLRDTGQPVDVVPAPVDLRDTWLLCQQLMYAKEPADLAPGTVPEPTVETDPMEIALWARTIAEPARRALRQRRSQYRQTWQRFFEGYDAVLLPVMGMTALPARDVRVPVLADRVTIDEVAMPMFALSMWCAIASAAGLPAVAMPVDRAPGGLPVGMQVVAGYGQDGQLLDLVVGLAGALHDGEPGTARATRP